ncbi:MAG: hypothetical protein J6A47_05870, partial [Bacilli bacterium]|nr:hypothetical protein [Bacilli bacterium]
NELDAWKDNAHFANMLRDSSKRIMFTIVNYSANMVAGDIVSITPWWSTLLTALTIGSGVLTAGALSMAIVSAVKSRRE